MPAEQSGTFQRERSGRWTARWYDENGKRRSKGGFETKRWRGFGPATSCRYRTGRRP
jgi:hypothetical protein